MVTTTTTTTTTASTYNDRNLEITIMPFHCDPFSLIIEFYFIKFKLCVYFSISIFHSFRSNICIFPYLCNCIHFSHYLLKSYSFFRLSSTLSKSAIQAILHCSLVPDVRFHTNGGLSMFRNSPYG